MDHKTHCSARRASTTSSYNDFPHHNPPFPSGIVQLATFEYQGVGPMKIFQSYTHYPSWTVLNHMNKNHWNHRPPWCFDWTGGCEEALPLLCSKGSATGRRSCGTLGVGVSKCEYMTMIYDNILSYLKIVYIIWEGIITSDHIDRIRWYMVHAKMDIWSWVCKDRPWLLETKKHGNIDVATMPKQEATACFQEHTRWPCSMFSLRGRFFLALFSLYTYMCL